MSFFVNVRTDKINNITPITLIFEVSNANRVGLFWPILCCIIKYKLIYKIITNMLHIVIHELIDPAQARFVPGRQLSGIFLVLKLIKGYKRKSMSPRCMIKIGMKKAYDYVEWSFL